MSDLDVLKTSLDQVRSTYRRPCILCGLGRGSLVMKVLAPDMLAVTVDTGYLFPESLAFLRELRIAGLEIQTARPTETAAEFERRHGGPLHHRDPEACCCQRKRQPLRRWLDQQGVDAVLVGARRDQSRSRSRLKPCILGRSGQPDQIAPLVCWTEQQVLDAYAALELPCCPLWERGYDSVGCQPCTAPGQGREGRWLHVPGRSECGVVSGTDADNP